MSPWLGKLVLATEVDSYVIHDCSCVHVFVSELTTLSNKRSGGEQSERAPLLVVNDNMTILHNSMTLYILE